MTPAEYRAHLDELRERFGAVPKRREIPVVRRRIVAWLEGDRVELACGHVVDASGAELAQRCVSCGLARLERRVREARAVVRRFGMGAGVQS